MDFIDRTKAKQVTDKEFIQLIPGPSDYFDNPGRTVTLYKEDMVKGVLKLSKKVKKIYEYKRSINFNKMYILLKIYVNFTKGWNWESEEKRLL